jgi:hypothetical protein
MMRAAELDTVVNALRKIGFRGVLMAVGNDAQLGPVIRNASASLFLAHHVTRSRAYADDSCTHVMLSQNMRMSEDAEFLSACNAVGYGTWRDATPFADDGSQFVRLPCSLFPAMPATLPNIAAARRWIHPTMFSDHPCIPFDSHTNPSVIITPTRQLELQHNLFFLHKLTGAATTYVARDEISQGQGRDHRDAIRVLGDDMVGALDDSGAPRGTLMLKPGAYLLVMYTFPHLSGFQPPHACRHPCPTLSNTRP